MSERDDHACRLLPLAASVAAIAQPGVAIAWPRTCMLALGEWYDGSGLESHLHCAASPGDQDNVHTGIMPLILLVWGLLCLDVGVKEPVMQAAAVRSGQLPPLSSMVTTKPAGHSTIASQATLVYWSRNSAG